MKVLHYLVILLSITSCIYHKGYAYDSYDIEEEADDFYITDDQETQKEVIQPNKINISEPIIPNIINAPLYFPVPDESDKLISVNISSSIPVIDLLVEIGRLADLNLDIDPKISGNIILKLKDKPINEVLQNIAKSAKIRYSKHGDVFRIEQDLPYVHNYYIDFINIQRSTKSSFIINNKVISNTGGDSVITSGSDNTIKSQYDGDLWFSLERNLNALIDINGTSDDEFFSTNREAGIVTLNAREGIHKAMEEYINKVKELTSSQVMIEAKIVEVTLDDIYQSGIDWEHLSYMNGPDSDIVQQTKTLILDDFDLESVVKTLNKFGVSKVISSPKLHALNNQQAVMSFTQNHVYFTVDIKKSTTPNNKSSQEDFSILSKMNSTPIGIILTIQPSIDVITEEIFMNVHPILSRINGYVKDPGTEYAAQKSKLNISSDIPIVEVREIDSMLKIRSGEVMVIGGLIEHRNIKESTKEIDKNTKAVETVIFLKATIIPSFSLLGTNLYLDNNF